MPQVEHEAVAYIANAFFPQRASAQKLGDHVSEGACVFKGYGLSQTVAQRDVGGIDAEPLVVGVAHLRGRVHEDGRLEGGEAELAEDGRPVGHDEVGLQDGIEAAEVALEDKFLARHVGVAGLERVPAGAVTLDVLGVWPYDDLVAAAERRFQHGVNAAVHNVVLLPAGGDEDDRSLVGHVQLRARLVVCDLFVEQVVAAFHEVLRGGALHLLYLAYLGDLVRAGAQKRVVVVVLALGGGHVHRGHVVEHVHVFDVAAHIGALDVEIVQIAQGGHHHVGVHLHHERDGALLADVVGEQPRLAFRQGEHLVVGVVRDVVDADVGMGEQPSDGALEVLVKAAALRVEDDVLAGDGEEPFEIGLLALGEGVALVPLRLLLADGVQALQFLAAGVELVVVDVLRWLDDDVAGDLHQDGEQIRADPVEGHAGRHKHAQEERERDGKPVGGVLFEACLLLLQGVDDVLGAAHGYRGQAGQHGHDPRQATVLDGDEAQKLGAGGAAVGDAVDDVDEAEQNEDLDGQRDEAEHRVVVLLLVERRLLLADGLRVAEVANLDAVERRHQLHHDDGVLLHPQRHGHEDDLNDDSEQQDGEPPVMGERIARVDDEGESVC